MRREEERGERDEREREREREREERERREREKGKGVPASQDLRLDVPSAQQISSFPALEPPQKSHRKHDNSDAYVSTSSSPHP